jgi:hypothetical protein
MRNAPRTSTSPSTTSVCHMRTSGSLTCLCLPHPSVAFRLPHVCHLSVPNSRLLRRAIIDCDEEALTEERLTSLLKNCVPQAEEMESINGYTGSLSNLGTAEQFFKVQPHQLLSVSTFYCPPSALCSLFSALCFLPSALNVFPLLLGDL